MRHRLFRTFCSILGGAFLLNGAAIAQDTKAGKLKIAVSPKQAYTFIDGKAIGPGDRTIKLDVGTHHLVVANYGFKFAEQEVSIDPGHTLPLDIKLERAGAEVPGPHGRIQIEVGMRRAGDAAILLNGSKPQYFVGHVDEFNNDIIKHQELVVPPGRHELTVTRYGKELWAGVVTVGANQRVIVDISNGKQVTKDWPRGSHELSAGVQRFKAGVVSATIAVAPVSGTVSANPPNIKCNQNTQLAWTSSETVEADMSGFSPVPTSGERTVSPRQTTVYELTATGPGGVTKPNTTVEVNTVVQSSLSASPTEVSYRRIGDKVLQQGNTTLNWSSSNSDAASLVPLGSVDGSGSKRSCVRDRKSTRLNSSHGYISYAVFCLKKKKKKNNNVISTNTNISRVSRRPQKFARLQFKITICSTDVRCKMNIYTCPTHSILASVCYV